MATPRRSMVHLREPANSPLRLGVGNRDAVRQLGEGRDVRTITGDALADELAALQQRKEESSSVMGGSSRSRQVVTRTTTERLVVEDETFFHNDREVSSEPIVSYVLRKAVSIVLAIAAAVFGTSALFAMTSSGGIDFLVLLVVTGLFSVAFLKINGYEYG